jgi:flagellar biosynthesis/type III secretory pathway protein FliH
VDWAEVERERDALLAAARAESERLVREGQEQAAAARAEARRESQEDLSQALQTLLEQFSEAFQARLQQFEEETPDLLAEMVHKVVGQLLERDDQLVVGVVHEALGQLAGARQVEVVINPADEAAVAAAQADLVSGLGEVNFRLHPSEDVPRGGAIVRTDRGEVDGRLHVQLEILRDRLRLM